MWFQRFSFNKNPFYIKPSPNLIGFQDERSRLVSLSRMGSIVWVRGKMGSGKTSMMLWLFQELKKNKEKAYFVPTYYKTKKEIENFLKNKVSFFERIFLRKTFPENIILIVDECQDLNRETVEFLRILWDENKLKSLIFSGTDLDCSEFTKDRMHIIDMRPMTLEEIRELLNFRLKGKKLFEDEAIRIIAEHSNYIPRAFLKNCEKVLMEAKEVPVTLQEARKILGIEEKIPGTIQEKILKLLKEKGPLTAKDISSELKISIQSTWKHISILYKKGLISKIRGKPVKYKIPES